MTKAVLLNGPILCGKDTLLDHLGIYYLFVDKLECKDHLHNLTMMLFNINKKDYYRIYNDRKLKERPLPEFRIYLDGSDFAYLERSLKYDLYSATGRNEHICKAGVNLNLSIREAMIYVSEVLCKPRFGKYYFGKVRADKIDHDNDEIIFDGSCGFPDELPPLIEKLGQENILLVRIHREGFTFEGDSRNYIPDGVIYNTVDLQNNGTLEEFLENGKKLICDWLEK